MDEHEFVWAIWDTFRRCFFLNHSIKVYSIENVIYVKVILYLCAFACESAWSSMVKHGQVWSGMVWHGWAWDGMDPTTNHFTNFFQSLSDHKSFFNGLLLRARFYIKGLSHRKSTEKRHPTYQASDTRVVFSVNTHRRILSSKCVFSVFKVSVIWI